MVSIFTGLGAGFERGSGTMLGSSGLLGSGSLGRNNEQISLNAMTGNLLISQRDEFLVGLGPDSAIARTYNSMADVGDDNNDNWRQSTDRRVHGLTGTVGASGSTVKRTSADGSDITYAWDGTTGAYVATDGAGAYDTMSYASGVWTWTDGDTRFAEKYELYGTDSWRITEVANIRGQKLTFTYTGANLTRVTTEGTGEASSYEEYSWSGSNITQILTGFTDLATHAAQTLTRTRYGYDSSNRLTSVTVDLSPNDNSIADGKTYVTTYTYDGTSKRVASISQSDGSQVAIAYDTSGRVKTFTQAAAGVSRVTTIVYGAGFTTIQDPLGAVTRLDYNSDGSLKKITAPPAYTNAAAQVTQFAYTALGSGNVSSVTDPLGVASTYTYDGSGNVLTATDRLGNVVTRTYGSRNELLTETRQGSDASGASASHTTRYAYGSTNLLTYIISPEGKVTVFQYGIFDEPIVVRVYRETFDLSAYTPLMPVSAGSVNAWVEGITDKTTNIVENYTRDVRGNIAQSRTSSATLADGNPDVSQPRSITRYVYDQEGQLLSRTVTGLNAETFIYDGLGRITASTDLNGNTTSFVFNDSVQQTVVTLTNGYVQTSVYNQAGDLISFTDSGSNVTGGTATYAYDQRGQLRVTTDATGHKSYMVYDKTGRKIADIDHYGSLIEYKYDLNDRLVATVRYTNKITGTPFDNLSNVALTPEMLALRPAVPTTTDLWTWTIHDAEGRTIETIDGDGGITRYQYDGESRLIGTVRYYNKLSPTELAWLKAWPAGHAANRLNNSQFSGISGWITGTDPSAIVNSGSPYSGLLGSKAYIRSDFTATAAGQVTSISTDGNWFAVLAGERLAVQAGVEGIGAVGSLGLRVHWRDANGNVIGTADIGNLSGTQAYNTKISGFTTVPVGAVSARLELYMTSSAAGTGTFTVIEPMVSVATAAQTTMPTFSPTVAVDPARDSIARNFYNKSGMLIGVLDGEGYLSQITYDIAGRKIAETAFATITTATLRAAGSFNDLVAPLLAAANPADRVMRYVYDGQGYLRFQIDGLNHVTEYVYDSGVDGGAIGVVRQTIQYAGTIGTLSDYKIATVKPAVAALASNPDNRKTWAVYDLSNRLAYAIDATGAVTGYSYDTLGQVTKTIRFATTRSTVTLPTLSEMALWQTSNLGAAANRVTRNYYTARGELRYTLDAEGYVSWIDYDAEGRAVTTKRWDTAIALSAVTDSTTIATIQSLATGTFVTNSTSYDNDGRVATETDGEGVVTFYEYNGNGTVGSSYRAYGTADQVQTTFTYDNAGRVLSRTNAVGSGPAVTSYLYDGMGNVVKITDPVNNAIYNYYDKLGRIISSRDAESYVTETSYTAFGEISSVTRRSNKATNTASASVLPVYVPDSAKDAVSYSYYNKLGQVAATRDADNYVTEYGYTVFGEVNSVIRRANKATSTPSISVPPVYAPDAERDATTLLAYDKVGRLLSSTDALGAAVTYGRNAFGDVVTEVDPLGTSPATTIQTTRTYDKRGLLKTEVVDSAAGGKMLTTTYGYDSFGRILSLTNPAIQVTTNTYDRAGRLTSSKDALNHITTYSYDRRGNLAAVQDVMGQITRYSYDKNDRLIYTVDALGGVTQNTYDNNGRVILRQSYASAVSLSGLAAITTTTEIAAALAARVSPLTTDQLSRSVYDANGQLRYRVDAGNFLTEFVYDSAGNPVRSIAYSTAITSSPTYTLSLIATRIAGMTATALAAARTTRNVYTANGQRSFTIDALGNVTAYTYDAQGNVVKQQRVAASYVTTEDPSDASMAAWLASNGSDSNDRISRAIYDKNGQLRFDVDPEGYVTQYTYDAAGSVRTSIRYADRYTVIDTTTLSGALTLVGATPPATAAVTEFKYDSAGRLTETVDPEGVRTVKTLNQLGQALTTAVAYGTSDESVTAHTYDALGRTLTETRGYGQPEATTSTFTYDFNGNMLTEQTGTSITTRTYDALGHVLTVTTALDASTNAVTTNTYDAFGNLVKMVDPRDNAGYFYYDARNQLVLQVDPEGFATATTYTFTGQTASLTRYTAKPIGTPTVTTRPTIVPTSASDATTTFTYDKLDQVIATRDAGGYTESYTFNAFGQRTEVRNRLYVAGTFDTTVYYTYDKRGLVVKETLPVTTKTSLGAPISVVNRYAYDARGNRIQMVEASGAAEERTTGYAYDKVDRLIATSHDAVTVVNEDLTSTSGVVPTETIKYDHRGNVIQTTDSGGASSYAVYDKRNNKIAEINPVGLVQTWVYDAAGNVTSTRTYATLARLPSAAGTPELQVRRMYDLALGRQPSQSEIDNWTYRMANHYPGPNAITSAFGEIVGDGGVQARFPNASSSAEFVQAVYRYAYQREATSSELSTWVGNMASGWTRPQVLSFFSESTNHADLNTQAMMIEQTSVVRATADYRQTSYTYDRANRLTATTVASLLTGEWNESAYVVTPSGDVVTRLEYDKAGNVIHREDGRGNDLYTWYDKLGRQIAQVDTENYLTVWARDAEGNVVTETRYATQLSGFTPGSAAPSGTANAADRITKFTYDKNGRRIKEERLYVAYTSVSANGVATDYAGTHSTATSTIVYAYNALGQVLTKIEANVADAVLSTSARDTTTYSYDAIGRLTRETGQAFRDYLWTAGGANATPTTIYAYDGLNNLTSMRAQMAPTANDADDRITLYTYDSGGRMATMADAAGFSHSYGYDRAGRTVRDSYIRTKSDGTTVTEAQVMRYDLAGRITTQTSARFNGTSWLFTDEVGIAYDATRLRYNAYGDVTGRGITAGPTGTAVYQETFDYDAGGRLWRSNTGDGVLRFHIYDKAGNETLTIASAGANLSGYTVSTYFGLVNASGGIAASGSVTAANTVTGVTVYDKRNQATFTRSPDQQLSGSASQLIVRGKTYNAFGEVSTETDPRGFDAVTGAALGGTAYTTSFTYNTMGRLLSRVSPQVNITAENGAVSSANPTEYYGYDLSGRLVSVTDANGIRTTRQLLAGSGHGGADPLVTKEFHPNGNGVFETRYDVFGNARILRNEFYNGSNALDSDDVQTFDKMGRLTSLQHRGNFLTDTYSYDLLGQRLTHYNSQLGASVKETTDYDSQGRVTKMVQLGGDTTSYSYAWDTSLTTAGLADYDGWVKTTVNSSNVDMTEKTDYFGRLISKTDFGDVATSLTFDAGGRLVTQAIAGGASTSYGWYNSGRQSSVTTGGAVSTYRYDAAGNRTYEQYVVGSVVYQAGTATWDAMNRMTAFDDAGVSGGRAVNIDYEYDAVGNVRHMVSLYYGLNGQGDVGPGQGQSKQDYWYRYDSMNRFTVTQGMLIKFTENGTVEKNASGQYMVGELARGVSGATVDRYTTGKELSYDISGQRKTATKTVLMYENTEMGSFLTTHSEAEIYNYRADGYLMTTNIAVGLERLDPDGWPGSPTPPYLDPGQDSGTGEVRAIYTRDGMGRVTLYDEYTNGLAAYSRSSTYNNKSQVTSDTVISYRQDGTYKAENTYYFNAVLNDGGAWDGVMFGGTYMGGAVTLTDTKNTKNYNDGDAPDTRTTSEFIWGDSGPIAKIATYDTNTGSGSDTPQDTWYMYDGSGFLTSVYIADGRPRWVRFINDAEGRILQRDEEDSKSGGDPKQLHYYFNGRRIGDISNNGTISNVDYAASIAMHQAAPAGTGAFQNGAASVPSYNDFDQSYDPINGLTYESTASAYTVETGDTLTTIAQALWGDASLWYLIAEANGLNGSEVLAAGRTLTIPNKVHNVHNSADTWRPYDPNEAQGDLSPTTPKPSKKNCGVLGFILLAVIAVAAAIATSGAILAATGAVEGGFLGGVSAVFGMTGAAAGITATAFSNALITAGAIGGAVGSIVSQGFGVITGLQDKFSWKGVALAAIGGAVGGATGANGVFGKAGVFGNLGGSAFVQGAARGILSSTVTQGIAVATKLQKKFDWTGVAAAAIGGGVTSEMGRALGLSNTSLSALNIGKTLTSGMAGNIANAATRSLIDGSDFGDNVMAALPDTIAATIGGIIGAAASKSEGPSQNPMNKRYSGKNEDEIFEIAAQDFVAGAERRGGAAAGAEARRMVDSDPEIRYTLRTQASGIFEARQRGVSIGDPEGLISMGSSGSGAKIEPSDQSSSATLVDGQREIVSKGRPKIFGDKVAHALTTLQDKMNTYYTPTQRAVVQYGLAFLKGGPLGVVGSYALDQAISSSLSASGADKKLGELAVFVGKKGLSVLSSSSSQQEDWSAESNNGREAGLLVEAGATLLGIAKLGAMAKNFFERRGTGIPYTELDSRSRLSGPDALSVAPDSGGVPAKFVGDSNLFLDRPVVAGGANVRAIFDDVIQHPDVSIVIPNLVHAEIAPTASQLARLGSTASPLEISATDISGVLAAHPSILSARFGVEDLQLLETARLNGLPVVTSNSAMVNQVASHAARSALYGDVPILVPTQHFSTAQELVTLLRH